MDDKEVNDRAVAAIRNTAVTKPHEVRHKMMDIARIVEARQTIPEYQWRDFINPPREV